MKDELDWSNNVEPLENLKHHLRNAVQSINYCRKQCLETMMRMQAALDKFDDVTRGMPEKEAKEIKRAIVGFKTKENGQDDQK